MKKYIVFLGLAALALFSCKKETASPSVAEQTEIVFANGGEFTAETRAVTDDSNLSSLYITATKGANETSVFSNVQFQKVGSGATAVWKGVDPKYWPENNENYHFAACNQQLTNFSVSPTGTGTDIVYDYLATTTHKATNTLELEHIFARIGTVKILAPEGCTVSGLVVSVQPKVSGTFNVKSESWTSTGSAQSAVSILPKAGSSPSQASISSPGGSVTSENNDLWLVPGEYVLSATYTIAKGDFSKEYTKSCTVNIIRGKVNNIGPVVTGGVEIPNIPEPEDIAEIQFSVFVVDWSNQNIEAQFN